MSNAKPEQPDELPQDVAACIVLTNEFAEVVVRRVRTRNGERLEISSSRLGRSIQLCPLELESLTWQNHDLFSAFLASPYGPEG